MKIATLYAANDMTSKYQSICLKANVKIKYV